jgi:hypothetical protein
MPEKQQASIGSKQAGRQQLDNKAASAKLQA